MNALPKWITDIGEAGGVPLMVADGQSKGQITHMPTGKAAAAVKAGTHISLQGRDMATFDLEAERAKRKTRNRAMTTEPAAEPAPAPQAAEAEPQPAEPPRTARVGRYANRALVTKPGQEN